METTVVPFRKKDGTPVSDNPGSMNHVLLHEVALLEFERMIRDPESQGEAVACRIYRAIALSGPLVAVSGEVVARRQVRLANTLQIIRTGSGQPDVPDIIMLSDFLAAYRDDPG